jgi:glucosylceramidase
VGALIAGTSAELVSFRLRNTGSTTGTATPYLTNGSSSMARQSAVPVTGGTLTATVAARSLVTYTIKR